MQLNYWKNPTRHDAKAERIYINALDGLPRDCKVWIENDQGRAQFRTSNKDIELGEYADIGEVERAVLARLVAQGDLASGATPSFGALRALTNSSAPNNRTPSTRPLRPTDRHQEALQLDIRSIKIDDPVRICVDHREPAELVDLLRSHPKVQVTYDEALPVGDILIEDAVIVERKCCTRVGQATDFESSITGGDKRLFYQSERMKLDPDKKGIIILEGDVYGLSTGMLVQAIDGAISFLTVIQGLSVWCTYNLNHTAYAIVKIASHHKNGLGYELGLRQRKHQQLLSQQRFVLEGLPGVNGTITERLLLRFGSVQGVANATYEELLEVSGVGPKKAKQIIDVLRSSYNNPSS